MTRKKESLFKDKSRLFPFGEIGMRQVLIERVGYRNAKPGELYLSGAIPTVYRATKSTSSPHLIVKAFKPGGEKVIIRERGDQL